MRAVLLLLPAMLVFPAACSDSGSGGSGAAPPACTLADLGDPNADIVLDVIALDVNQDPVALADGADLALVTPPQGGRVSFVGVHATNLSPCGVTLTGSIKDTATGKIMFDSRTVNLKPGADGYGTSSETNIASFANVPVCPNQWSSANAYDVPYELTVGLEDKAGRKASKTITVTPRCAESGDAKTTCECICKLGYVLGQTCP